jgi:WD repeat-containing protein 26
MLDAHAEVVTALAWLPDGSGFISGGLDRKIILWVRTFTLSQKFGPVFTH